MEEIAKKYYEAGLSVIPVHQNKVPIGKWEENTKTLLPPKDSFKKAEGIGLVCGEVSGGVEVIDIDQKYSLDGKLWDEFKEIVDNTGSDVMSKVVIQKTQNGGYHVIYKCKKIEGNQKFASRFSSSEELKEEPNRKVQGLMESRGRGGYIMISPSNGYKVIQGDLFHIHEITEEDREILISCARSFHEVPDIIPMPKPNYDGVNPFAEYNDTADVGGLLQKHGWKYVKEVKGNQMYLRPGSSSAWSAGFDPSKRLLYVFTSSTIFEPNKAFNPSQVLCYLEFNKDYKEMYKWLRDRNYGDKTRKITEDKPKNSFLTTAVMEMSYLKSVRDGTFKMGLTTGFDKLDLYYRHKEMQLNMMVGFDNTGKSQVEWYLSVLCAKIHGWRYLIWAGENKAGNVFRKLIEFYLCKPLIEMTDAEFKKAREWVDFHFRVISNKNVFDFINILDIADEAIGQQPYNKLIVDPWNGLNRNKKISLNSHEHDEEALRMIRNWIPQRKCSVDILAHPATEAYRRRHPKDHPKYAGMLVPPDKGDTEGGGKFGSKADDFISLHRYTQHSEDWRWNEIHVKKIKETETGGRQTFLDSPFRMKMLLNQCGFEDEDGYNPILKTGKENTTKRYEKEEEMPY